MILRSKLIFFILLFCPLWLLGQYSNTIHYTVKDGLPSSTVYSAVQDSMGFIWLGTEAGLVRFDGAKFKVYTTQDGLPDNEVLGLMFDSITNRLWIITYSKSACYYRNGKFYTAKNDSSLAIIKCQFGEYINGNRQAGQGVFLYNGNNVYRCAHDTLSSFRSKYSGILCVHQYGDSIFDMIVPPQGLIRHTPNSETVYENIGNNNVYASSGSWIGNLFFLYKEGKIVIYTKLKSGEYILRDEVRIAPKRFASNVLQVANDYFFAVPDVGVYKVDVSLNDTARMIWQGGVNYISKDRHENIWITTSDDGLFIIKKETATNF